MELLLLRRCPQCAGAFLVCRSCDRRFANDNWVAFTLRYVVDHRARRLTKDRLFTEILARIDASEHRVAIASMTVQLVEAPTLDVRLSRATPRRDA